MIQEARPRLVDFDVAAALDSSGFLGSPLGLPLVASAYWDSTLLLGLLPTFSASWDLRFLFGWFLVLSVS